jgi:hypothetical protein
LIAAPKNPRLNSIYRRRIIERADVDEEFRDECWIRASRDPIWCIDTFAFTYSPKDHPDCPDQPFILWPCQERAFKQIDAAFGKHPLLGEKSRDMGFTWIIVAAVEQRWHFRKKQTFLFGSRKEEYVDKAGDPKCLFWKFDYLVDNYPGWLQPYHERKNLHRENFDTNSTVDGESTNDNFARGDRRTAIPLDEFPSIENGYAIERAAGDATHCPIYFGTPGGATGAFFDIRTRMVAENPERIVRLHWSEHPEKSKGLYTSEKDENGNYQKKIIDVDYEYPEDYRFVLDGKLRSMAYDERERRAPNKRVMAQEWDIDYLASAWQWFDSHRINDLKKKYAKPPNLVGDILFDPDWKRPRWMTNERGGKVQFWGEVETDQEDRKKPIIPKFWNDVVAACDIGLGTAGEYSSNSVASFYRRSTGQLIAKFTCNDQSPTDFCRRVLALCVLFNNAYLGWESNGPGGLFTSEVKKSGYRNVYYSEKNWDKFIDEKGSSPGWHSNKDSKKILLEDYANALIDGKIENYCEEALDECGQYVHEPGGVIIHAKAKSQGKDKTDPTEAGENHGDHVIADALANFLIGDLTKREIEKPPEKEPPPPGSFGARSLAFREAQENQPRRWGSFRVRQDA